MNNLKGMGLDGIKVRLTGVRFRKLLIAKGVKKYRMAIDCRISHRTLCNWAIGKTVPKDELAIKAGRYLGLIDPEKSDLIEIKKMQKELQKKINRLTKNGGEK